MSTNLIQECHRRAAEARRMADATIQPTERAKLLQTEQRWLIAARSVSPEGTVCGPAGAMTRVNSISQEVKQISKHGPQPLPDRKRPTKFTPENIQQIRQLVTEGKSREEIAKLIGVTVGSLQVTCSRLGISLRRSIINVAEKLVQRQGQAETQAPSVSLAIGMYYRGHERTADLMVTEDMLSQLVVEAQFRSMNVPALVGELIAAALRNDVFRQVLDAEQAPK